MPLVSVCIPTLNRPDFLSQAIHSVIDQSFQDWEIIIFDNHSDTAEENRRLIEKLDNPKIKYYFSSERLPMAENWNNCLKKSSGAYVKYLMDDDILHPQCLEIMTSVFADYPSLALASVDRALFYRLPELSNIFFNQVSQNLTNRFSVMNGQDNHYLMYLDMRPFGTPTQVMFNRTIASTYNLFFDQYFGESCDTGMWINLLRFGDGALINLKLCAERKHLQQASKKWSAKTFADNFLKTKSTIYQYLNLEYKNKLSQKTPEFLTGSIILLNFIISLRKLHIGAALDFGHHFLISNYLSGYSLLVYWQEIQAMLSRKKNIYDISVLQKTLN
ncbi:glycosyltransferase family A protein [[Phormidium] sp. ETS-05]|uniref:glycosyltransferase family 2 protein n=1 Tax=[Phormidium] sp. ETS-05 TaxID=222819 RepID=UPI0018EEFE19|nr:glycosyltransferase family A protein [[Phormidium] sp. ETS-05]